MLTLGKPVGAISSLVITPEPEDFKPLRGREKRVAKVSYISSDDNGEYGPFDLDMPSLLDHACAAPGIIARYADAAAEAKKAYNLADAARKARRDDVIISVRTAAEATGKKVTDTFVKATAQQDAEYRALVLETIYAEADHMKAEGRLSAAFAKVAMLKGVLFSMGRQVSVEEQAFTMDADRR